MEQEGCGGAERSSSWENLSPALSSAILLRSCPWACSSTTVVPLVWALAHSLAHHVALEVSPLWCSFLPLLAGLP